MSAADLQSPAVDVDQARELENAARLFLQGPGLESGARQVEVSDRAVRSVVSRLTTHGPQYLQEVAEAMAAYRRSPTWRRRVAVIEKVIDGALPAPARPESDA